MSGRLELSAHLREHLPSAGTFDAVMALTGTVYREHKHRRTVRAEIGGRAYFVKVHRGTVWREILKNALRGRWPTLTAETEWNALHRLRACGVPTLSPVGLGVRGRFPAKLESFLITESLEGFAHLDEACKSWVASNPRVHARLKQRAIYETARITRGMHTRGMNHRDCYLCHFMLPERDFESVLAGESLSLHIIDLHRAQIRRQTPSRMIAKDLAGLLFSSLDEGLTSIDTARFLRTYWPDEWKTMLRRRRRWLRGIIRRSTRVYRADHGRSPRLPAHLASF